MTKGLNKLSWLPDMDLNHDKQIQSLLCYRYTIGQAGVSDSLTGFPAQSSRQAKAECDTNWEISLAPGFSRVIPVVAIIHPFQRVQVFV